MRDRRKITVQGIVQGVGFRPFVYGLASRLGLDGMVRNDPTGVVIDVEGELSCLESFLRALVDEAPPLARIERIWAEEQPIGHYTTFAIEPSETRLDKHAFIAADVTTCATCLQEFNAPRDRRYHNPFLNCTNCGPRFTIVSAVPYDRERTTMARFPMCTASQGEYADPCDRRFHAQPAACPRCGPRLWVADFQGAEICQDDPLAFIGVRVQEMGGFAWVRRRWPMRSWPRDAERKGPAQPTIIMGAISSSSQRDRPHNHLSLNEMTRRAHVGIALDEKSIPIREDVKGACERLGIDPLYVANEGKLNAVVGRQDAEQVLERMRSHQQGQEVQIIGEVGGEHTGMVIMRTGIGGTRIVEVMLGEQLPRIC